MKIFAILPMILAVALTACAPTLESTGPPGSGLGNPPAPLNATTLDDTAINVAFETFDVALYAIEGLQAAGTLARNSPRALAVQAGVIQVQKWLNIASAAQKAGSASSYTSALSEASKAIAGIKAALRGDSP
jgi:hypothetical protein